MKTRRGRADRGSSRKARAQSVPALERFEDRLLMAAFTVTSTADSVTATANDGSLRGAILASNATTTANQIVFNLPAGVQAISVVAPLPKITDAVQIDGSTANGFSAANPVPLIQITGNNPAATNVAGPGFDVEAPGVEINNLIIDNFKGNGIDLNGGGGIVAGCYIGVDPTGAAVAKNTGPGIVVGSSNNSIGATTTGTNVISGNDSGINITSTGANNNVVTHTFIGTDATGLLKLGNTFDAIDISTAGNTIGGISATGPQGSGAGNLISGNFEGISILSLGASASGNVIEGNYIGTNLKGMAAIANTFDGVDDQAGPNNTIGSTVAGGGNVISGNGFKGMLILGSGATRNLIVGNSIGVAADGTTPLGNGDTGILFNGAGTNLVGGSNFSGYTPQYGNVIAYNGATFQSAGVEVLGAANDGILSNRIFGNAGLGIDLFSGNAGVQAPTLTSVQSGTSQTLISGTLFGNAMTTYRLQFFSSTILGPSGTGDGRNYLGDVDVVTDANGNATFNSTLSASVPVGDYVSATATQGPLVTDNTSEFSKGIQSTQAAQTDLAVTTSVPSTGPFLNQPYAYTVKVTNNGPDAATGVVLTDTLPSNATFLSTSAGTEASGVVTDDIGTLASGATVTVTIKVKPTSTVMITNTATVTGDQLDSNTLNNTSTTTGTVLGNADLSVLLSPSATLTPVGSPITYTLTVSNAGPSSSGSTMETVTFPSTFTNLVVMPDQGTYTVNADNSVTINTGIVPASGSSTILIEATPTAVGVANVTATVTASILDSNPANNTVTVPVTVANAADLGVTISATPDPVLVDNELLYSVVVTNNGPSTATAPRIFDKLPSGVSFVASDSSPELSLSNGAVTGTLSPLASGDSVTLTIAVLPTVSGQVSNSVTVGDPNTTTPNEIDPDLTNNTATTTTQVSPADIGVNVINPSDPLFVGKDVVYQLQVTNNGPATATNVLLKDLFTGGVKIVGASAGTISGASLSANLGSLASGASKTISLTVDPTTSGTLINSASVSSDELDPDPNNNTSSSSNLVSPVDLNVGVTTSTSQVVLGQSLAYLVKVTNGGAATATNVIFRDTFPTGSVLTSLVPSQGHYLLTSAGHLAGNLGSLASGASATITFVVTPTVLGTATNTASFSSDQFDTNASNNSVTSSTGVINLPGSIQFGSAATYVPENGGSVAVAVTRTNGSLGAVTAKFHTSDYTAIAGVNYVATSGTVTFAAGQTTTTIVIPVLDDRVINGTNSFFVVLTSPTGGASIGAQAVTAVAVTNVDRDTTPPVVSNLIAIANGSSLNGFVITFDKAMDPARASLVANYHVFLSGGSNSGTPVPLVAANYDPTSHSVTLVPTASLPSNRFYEVVANGTVGPVLTDVSGNVLAGSSGPGSNYVAYYGQGNNLTYTDSENNSVNINLTGGGTLAIFRAANGDATTVDLYSIVPRHSRLSGSVTKLNKFGTGHTTIGTINGFGKFGDVYSNLTTPSFYVGSAPVSTSSLKTASSTTGHVSALAVTTTAKKKTPKAPAHKTR